MNIYSRHGFVQVLHAHGAHKYLGRCFKGDLRNRGLSAVEHRVACGWSKFRNLQQTLTNRHISIRLRLKLFDAVVTPTVLYSLETAPLKETLLQKLDVTQRTMLRRMVGWVCYDADTWEERGRRMKMRLQQALQQHQVADWSDQIAGRKVQLREHLVEAPYWTRTACAWDPCRFASRNGQETYRCAGRPRMRW